MSNFDEWHFNKWKLQNAATDTVEFAKVLYDRVYSREQPSNERDLERAAWDNRQAVIDGLKAQLIKEGYVDNGGRITAPTIG